MSRWRLLLTVFLAGGLFFRSALPAEGADPEDGVWDWDWNWSLGPLFDEFPLVWDEGTKIEALGPLIGYQKKDLERLFTISPLFAHVEDSGADFTEIDLGYPVITYDRFGTEYRFQTLQLLSVAGGENQKGDQQHRVTLFPIFFQQRSTDPKLNYTALLPVYGTLKNRLFRDETRFVMWPLYVKSRKQDIVTHNFPFPVFHLRTGRELRGWQLWPLLGMEEKGLTWRTNVLDERVLVGGHRKLFALWPIFFYNDLEIGTENPQKVRVTFPLYSSLRSPNRDSTTYLWPLFTFTNDREKKYREFDFFGPVVVFARGEGKTATRIWPLFSVASSPTLESRFFLWPIYKYNRIRSAPLERRRTRLVWVLYSDLLERNTETGDTRRRRDFWPFYTYHRALDGRERLQVLSILEPCLPNNKSIERNYSPMWALWRQESNPKTGAASQSLLWNLYRRERTPSRKKCSLLFGLIQYQSDIQAGREQKRWRIFYLPLKGKTKAQGPPGRTQSQAN